MQCPLCRESVADDNALQVHYLMSCLGYLENASTSQHKQAPPSKKIVQFRWIKTKPTLAREVYLISSVAGSVKLEWRPIDECFLSDQVEVSQGLHVCQLIVDGDSMSTDDFNVSDTSRTIDVLISEASQAEVSTGNTSGSENHEPPTQQTPHLDHTDEQDGRSEVTTQQLPPEGSLYRELLKHQILHGDSLETLTGDASSGRRDRTHGQQGDRKRGQRGDRTRANGVATRIARDQRSGQDSAHRESTGVHITRPGHAARSDISDLPNERQRDDVLRDSMSSDELQQFLQPTRTRQESNGEAGNADVGTTEDRESSLSENEDHSVSLSSHEGLEKRPELLGQSNGETESRVQPDTRVSDQDPDVDVNHEESVSDHRQETLLVDLREPSSGRDREGSSMGRRDESGTERKSDDHREGSSRTRHRVPLDRGETTGDLPEKLSGNDRRRLSDDSRERPSSSRRKQSSRNHRGQSSGDGREPTGDINEHPEDHRESSGSHREPSANKREALDGDNLEPSEDNRDRSGDSREPSENNRQQSSSLRTEASSGLRQETSSGLQERISTDNHDPESVDSRERTSVGRLEGTSGDERRKETSVNTSSYVSLPAKLYPDLTQITRTDALTNTRTTTVQSGLFSGDLISPRRSGTSLTDSHGLDSQTRGLISPGSSATSLPGRRGLDSENNVTDDLLFRSYSTGNSGLRTNTAFTRDTPSRDFAAPTSDSAPSREIDTQSKDIGGHNSEISAQRRDESDPNHEIGAQSRDTNGSNTEISARNRDTSGPNREMSSQSRDTSGSNREISAESRDVSGPNREISAQSRDTSGPSRDISTQRRDAGSSNREISGQSRDTSGTNREISAQSRDTSGSNREISGQSRDTSGTNREISAQSRDTSGSNREISAQRRDTNGSNREISAQRRDVSGPNREISAQSRDTSGSNREISAQSRDTSGTNREISAQRRDTSGPNREISAHSRDTNGPSREVSSQSRDTSGSNREMSSQNRDISASREGNRYQQTGLGGDILALTRRSPQGSFMDDSSIRRPPLYTSAPSRPSSSPPYSYHTAISPLSSPRDGEVAVSSSSRYGPSSVSRATTVTTQSMLDRGSPTGSALSPEGAQAVTSGAAATSKQFSEDGVKELLENLKNQSSRRKFSPETSPRERLGASEISALRQKLVERNEAVKKLKAKNASYKERIEQLREKEMELTKALSLAETNRKALREQEEISSELENALGEKEKQCAEMEVKVLEMKREKRRMEAEFEQGKKDYEKKIHDLRKVHVLLEQEVKTLRENSRQTSSKYSSDYKEVLEKCQEYLAVSASLKDQVQTLEKENKDLKEKLKILTPSRQANLTSGDHYPSSRQDHSSINTSRDHYSSSRPDHQDHSSINGYLDTNPSHGGHQFDSLQSQTDPLRHNSSNDRYLPTTTRDSTTNTRYPYDSHRPVLENSRAQTESTDHRTNRSRPLSETNRFESQLDEILRDRPESRRGRSDICGSGSFEASPRVERSKSRESRSRQRLTTADDVTSRTSDRDYRYLLPKRSHSSDAIRNEFPDASRSKISPSQERGSQEMDRRSKDRSRLYHSGSYDHLNSRSATSTQTRDLTLTGHRVDLSPTSPDPSPRSQRRSSPEKGSPFAPDTPQQIDIGMTVLVSRHCGRLSRGIVQYVGYLPDKGDNVYVGLELHDTDGKHDGKFNGRRFFKCKPNHGVFVLFEKIVMAYT